MKIKKYVAMMLFIILLAPHISNAKIVLSEIMYDPPGTDTGREWVEVYNDGVTPIDLSTMRLFENNVAHTMKAFIVPAALLLADTYAIIADNPEKFMIDYPTYSGLLIDSAFSLNNTGESITVQSIDGVVDSTVEYSAEWGAAGNGNTLQLSGGIWIPALPTVAVPNATEPANESVDDSDNSNTASTTSPSSSGSSSVNTTSSHSSQVPVSTYKPKIAFEVSVGRDRYGFVNTPIQFTASHNQDKTSGMKFLWTSGDGEYDKGKIFTHTYVYEGEYNLVLNSAYQGKQSVARNKVFIRTPEVVASVITRGKLVDIMLENRGQFEVNLGGYKLYVADADHSTYFSLPPDTILSANKAIVVPAEVSGMEFEFVPNALRVLYPNGRVLFESLIL